ncbi:MAG: glycosyltransferase family 2 protein [Solirubrobacterales bacterium]
MSAVDAGASPVRVADRLASIVLPVHNQADHLEPLVGRYREALARLPLRHQIVLVPNACRDETPEICRRMTVEHPEVIAVELAEGGWGRAVRAGLAAAEGDLLCYTNSARTSPEMLSLALLYASSNPDVVIKAQRRIRDNWRRQLGSLLYNLECRVLFGLASWDINGTPKVFPRTFDKLLELRSDDDLIDAEFVVTCRREAYPVIEVPSTITIRHGGTSTTKFSSAARMYLGAYSLRRRLGSV